MSNTVKLNTCPKCGAPIPAEAPQGLCPKCVLRGAATATDAGVPATATSEIPSIERIATAFPQLEILELIGRGGMGFVFKARQPHLDRFVALKLLPDKLAKDAQFAERFNREGRVLAKLNHPSIVSVFDFGQTGGFYYLLMEYVDGVNLRQAMRAGRFSPVEALSIVPKVCEALQYAHEQGILHRDIKPENILLDTKGRVKIADFGIAKLIGEEQPGVTLTNTGAALGTLHYMAPEQLEKPSTVDHRADIYSLGVVFYDLLTGELPIGRFAAPSTKTPVGTNVDEVVFRTLEKEPGRRYQSAGEVQTCVQDLADEASAAEQRGPTTPPAGAGESARTAQTPVSRWSIYGAMLVGLSLPAPLMTMVSLLTRGAGMDAREMWLTLGSVAMPGLGGTLLGWLGLNEIRENGGRVRGLPLAMFATLMWPLTIFGALAVGVPMFLLVPGGEPTLSHTIGRFLVLLLPAGVIAFGVWTIHATALWAGQKQVSPQRGLLKWVFIGVLVIGMGVVMVTGPKRNVPGRPTPSVQSISVEEQDLRIRLAQERLAEARALFASRTLSQLELSKAERDLAIAEARGDAAAIAGAKLKYADLKLECTRKDFENRLVSQSELRAVEGEHDLAKLELAEALKVQAGPAPAPRIQFTFTAVELLEEAGARRLAMDYVEQIRGNCERYFRYDANVPGFTAQTRMDAYQSDAKAGFAPVLHQRVSWKLPPSLPQTNAIALRDLVAREWLRKSVVIEPGDERVFFKVVVPDGGSLVTAIGVKLRKTGTGAQPESAIGSARLIAGREYQNFAIARIESVPGHSLHQMIARFAGPEISAETARTRAAISGPLLVPSPDEDMNTPAEPVAGSILWGTNRAPVASAISLECPGDYSLQFVLPDENLAREASRQMNQALAQPVSLVPGRPVQLFTIGKWKGWLEARPFKPEPNRLSFFRHPGRSPAQIPGTNLIESAVATIPPGHELKVTGRVVVDGVNQPEPAFSTTLTSGPNEPGTYWFTWYLLPNPQRMDLEPKANWELQIHDAAGREWLRSQAPERLNFLWRKRWVGDEPISVRSGKQIRETFFEKVPKAGDRSPTFVLLEMTMQPSVPEQTP